MKILALSLLLALVAPSCGDQAPSLDAVLDRTAASLDALGDTLSATANSDAVANARATVRSACDDMGELARELAEDPRLAEAGSAARAQAEALAERVRGLMEQIAEHPELQAELERLQQVLADLLGKT